MITITNRIRVLIALGAVGATVGGTAVASAAPLANRSVTTVPTVKPIVKPIVVFDTKTSTSHVGPVRGAGSAGIEGYDDAACESLAQDYNTAESYGDQAAAAGDTDTAASYYNQANNIYQQMSGNCFVID